MARSRDRWIAFLDPPFNHSDSNFCVRLHCLDDTSIFIEMGRCSAGLHLGRSG